MYPIIKLIHVGCAVITVTGFMLRGYWMIVDSPWLQYRVTRIAPHVVDTAFLLSGVAMLVMLSLNPLSQDWLIAKFAGLIGYIGLGMVALRRGRTRGVRIVAFAAALAAFCYIAGVAFSHSPASWLAIQAR